METERMTQTSEQQLWDVLGKIEPVSELGRELVVLNGDNWREAPYLHEQVVVRLWVCLSEKERLTEEDLDDLLVVLKWVNSHKEEDLKNEREMMVGERREKTPLLMNSRSIMTERQIREFEHPRFLEREDWEVKVRRAVGAFIYSLGGIYRDWESGAVQEMEEELKAEGVRAISQIVVE